MPDKCCVFNCQSNYYIGPKETVFLFLDEKKDHDLRQRWIRFVNREGWKPSKKLSICRKHSKGKRKRYRLVKKLKQESKHMKSSVSIHRESPTKRVYQQDRFKLFEGQDKIKSFNDIDSTLVPLGYTFQKYDDHVVFYCLETYVLNVPEVTDCVRIDRDLHVKLFYKGLPFLYHSGLITKGPVVLRKRV